MQNERVHRSCSQDCCAPFSSERDRVKSRIFADASTRSWNLSSVLISSRYRTSRLVKFRAAKPRLSASCFTSVGNRLKSRSIIHLVGFVAPNAAARVVDPTTMTPWRWSHPRRTTLFWAIRPSTTSEAIEALEKRVWSSKSNLTDHRPQTVEHQVVRRPKIPTVDLLSPQRETRDLIQNLLCSCNCQRGGMVRKIFRIPRN
jgi:hypothetical protein